MPSSRAPTLNPWDDSTLKRRIAAPGLRHSAGCPSGDEIAIYSQAVGSLPRQGTALVLGMTPELRLLAARHFGRVVAVDHNPAAIALYAGWLPANDRLCEQILETHWLAGIQSLTAAPTCVLADMALPNLDPAMQSAILQQLHERLARQQGLFVTRQLLIPPELETGRDEWPALLAAFRCGGICENALGLGLRMTGFLASCWQADDGHLDNVRVFAKLDALLAAGELTSAEHSAAERFRFGGSNWVFRQRDWEAQIADAGWHAEHRPLTGRHWHAYCPIYVCTPAKC